MVRCSFPLSCLFTSTSLIHYFTPTSPLYLPNHPTFNRPTAIHPLPACHHSPSLVIYQPPFEVKYSTLARFLLTYHPTRTSPQSLQVYTSGPDPCLPSIRESLFRQKTTTAPVSNETDGPTGQDQSSSPTTTVPASVLFGYAEIAGKGMVLAYLGDGVG